MRDCFWEIVFHSRRLRVSCALQDTLLFIIFGWIRGSRIAAEKVKGKYIVIYLGGKRDGMRNCKHRLVSQRDEKNLRYSCNLPKYFPSITSANDVFISLEKVASSRTFRKLRPHNWFTFPVNLYLYILTVCSRERELVMESNNFYYKVLKVNNFLNNLFITCRWKSCHRSCLGLLIVEIGLAL